MREYDIQAFEDLNVYASSIGYQNSRYAEAGRIKHPKFARRAQNTIAAEQAEYVDVLGELSAELPYEEIALDYLRTEEELLAAQTELETVDSKHDIRKLGVICLADSITKLLPWCQDTADKRVAERIAEINLLNKEAAQQRIAELRQQLDELGLVFEAAAGPWPVPQSAYEEEPEDTRVFHTNGNGNGNGVQPQPEQVEVAVEEEFCEPTIITRETEEERIETFVKR